MLQISFVEMPSGIKEDFRATILHDSQFVNFFISVRYAAINQQAAQNSKNAKHQDSIIHLSASLLFFNGLLLPGFNFFMKGKNPFLPAF
jgi:hypothetical protein